MLDEQSETSRQQTKRMNRKIYQQKLAVYHETIDHLQETIRTMEQQLQELERIESEEKRNDHRFIDELFQLCRQHSSHSSHDDMKTYVQQTFNQLVKRSSKVDFTCKCSEWRNPNHYPNYRECLDFLEQYQKLFDIQCFKQIPISSTDFYHKYGELNNFIRSISITVGEENQNEELVIKALKNIVEDSKFDLMNRFKRLAGVKTMHEAIRKMHAYDNFVPYYHQFIEQVVRLLEVSKSDQIIPAIKTLQLLAKRRSVKTSLMNEFNQK